MVQFVSLVGKAEGDLAYLARVLKSPHYHNFNLFCGLISVLVRLKVYSTGQSDLLQALLWAIAFIALMAIYFSLVALSVVVLKRFGKTHVYLPVISAVSNALMQVVTHVVADWLGITWQPTLTDSIAMWVADVGAFELGTIFFNVFVYPKIVPHYNGAHAYPSAGIGTPVASATPSSANMQVPVDGVMVRAGSILRIEAADHYIYIHFINGEQRMMRQTIGTFAKLMPAELGRMVHRSHWISAQAVQRVLRNSNSAEVQLKNGVRIPVARGRIREVIGWAHELNHPEAVPSVGHAMSARMPEP